MGLLTVLLLYYIIPAHAFLGSILKTVENAANAGIQMHPGMKALNSINRNGGFPSSPGAYPYASNSYPGNMPNPYSAAPTTGNYYPSTPQNNNIPYAPLQQPQYSNYPQPGFANNNTESNNSNMAPQNQHASNGQAYPGWTDPNSSNVAPQNQHASNGQAYPGWADPNSSNVAPQNQHASNGQAYPGWTDPSNGFPGSYSNNGAQIMNSLGEKNMYSTYNSMPSPSAAPINNSSSYSFAERTKNGAGTGILVCKAVDMSVTDAAIAVVRQTEYPHIIGSKHRGRNRLNMHNLVFSEPLNYQNKKKLINEIESMRPSKVVFVQINTKPYLQVGQLDIVYPYCKDRKVVCEDKESGNINQQSLQTKEMVHSHLICAAPTQEAFKAKLKPFFISESPGIIKAPFIRISENGGEKKRRIEKGEMRLHRKENKARFFSTNTELPLRSDKPISPVAIQKIRYLIEANHPSTVFHIESDTDRGFIAFASIYTLVKERHLSANDAETKLLSIKENIGSARQKKEGSALISKDLEIIALLLIQNKGYGPAVESTKEVDMFVEEEREKDPNLPGRRYSTPLPSDLLLHMQGPSYQNSRAHLPSYNKYYSSNEESDDSHSSIRKKHYHGHKEERPFHRRKISGYSRKRRGHYSSSED